MNKIITDDLYVIKNKEGEYYDIVVEDYVDDIGFNGDCIMYSAEATEDIIKEFDLEDVKIVRVKIIEEQEVDE